MKRNKDCDCGKRGKVETDKGWVCYSYNGGKATKRIKNENR